MRFCPAFDVQLIAIFGAQPDFLPYHQRRLPNAFTFKHIQSQGAIRDYVAMANLFAFSSHLGAFKPITRSHRNTDPSTRKAETIT